MRLQNQLLMHAPLVMGYTIYSWGEGDSGSRCCNSETHVTELIESVFPFE